MTHETVAPQVLEEPKTAEKTGNNDNIWMRGLFMLILIVLFGVAEFLLGLAAVIQFFWMLIGKEKNEMISDFGKDLAAWLAKVAEFQTGVTEDKPFPFTRRAQ
ncbi:DUF4389 domain-containing protein [Aliiroseovarius subalbicans]|uniref:DUF4389 domain-containing protein n=1 Tax=Aliiroseovarius subalbicans TaxID=2925840 RepID=UPI001F58BE90|nr:DUF4389 domain-containing protein [Aliiroseovarius subalbicans]MCI2398556.1 DUF4389 domain-containing protein [Aliiroseovarius subalbicans]